jgi:hypothetical protein
MEDFKWTDSLVKEFQIFYNKIPYAITGIDPIKKGIEMFKESKEKKEYEVLSFKHKNERYNLTNDGNYGRINFFNPASLNHVPENAEILSVKRLYDGAIFSVGEKVYLKASDGKGVFYINEFTIKDGQCFASSGINIMQLEKAKEVLFTTEDGVGIHEGDTYYTLEPDNNWFLYYSGAASYGSGKRTIAKYFSTKEAAEDWLNWNKPKYSKKEMEACYEHALTQGVHGCSFKSYMNWMENYFSKPKL